jgi:hypothetical protein
MGQNRAFGLFSKIHQKVRVKGQAALLRIHVEHHQEGALPGKQDVTSLG